MESEQAKGSRFSFNVWLEAAGSVRGKEADHPAAAPDLAGSNVLIVDDIDLNRKIAAAFLKKLGPVIEHAENGREALDKFNQSASGHYKLILMDMQMPVMDGITATEEIRASAHPDAQKVAIVAMTANVFKEDVEAVLAAGMNGYIGKPVKLESLLQTLSDVLK